MITKQQLTDPHVGTWRNADFSQWITHNLPNPQSGFCVGNQDWLLWNYKTKRLMLCEEKCYGKFIDKNSWQFKFFRDVIDPALRLYCSTPQFLEQAGKDCQIEYRGYHYITFESTSPDNGRTWFDGKEISKEQLNKILSLE